MRIIIFHLENVIVIIVIVIIIIIIPFETALYNAPSPYARTYVLTYVRNYQNYSKHFHYIYIFFSFLLIVAPVSLIMFPIVPLQIVLFAVVVAVTAYPGHPWAAPVSCNRVTNYAS